MSWAVPISAISDMLEVSFEYTPHPFIEELRRHPLLRPYRVCPEGDRMSKMSSLYKQS